MLHTCYFIVLSLILSPIHHAFTAESDQFLLWGVELKDSKNSFNRLANEKLERSVRAANRGRRKVKKNKCPKIAKDYMGRLGKNTKLRKITKFDFQEDTERSRNYPVEIYPPKEVPYEEYYLKSIHNKQTTIKKVKKLARVINVGGVYFGADKITHFVTSGGNYHKRYLKRLKKGDTKEEAMKYAIRRSYYGRTLLNGVRTGETGLLGLRWGTFSYADMEANYQGMRLAIDICEGPNPHLEYVDKKWVIKRKVDLTQYFTPAFDESFNPNYYRTKKLKNVSKMIREFHCKNRNTPSVLSRMSFYRRTYRPTFNHQYVRELLDKDIARESKLRMKEKNRYFPTPRSKQTLDKICEEV